MGPYRHYSIESQTSQLGPSILSNLSPRPLVGIKSRGACRTCCCRPKEARRRRRRGAAAAPGSRAPTGFLGTARGGSWLPGHGDRWRPEKGRRRRRNGGEAPGGWCTLVGGRSLLRGGPTWPGHARRWPGRRQQVAAALRGIAWPTGECGRGGVVRGR